MHRFRSLRLHCAWIVVAAIVASIGRESLAQAQEPPPTPARASAPRRRHCAKRSAAGLHGAAVPAAAPPVPSGHDACHRRRRCAPGAG